MVKRDDIAEVVGFGAGEKDAVEEGKVRREDMGRARWRGGGSGKGREKSDGGRDGVHMQDDEGRD